MSYQIRVASANGYYHVTNRGNNKLNIFESISTKSTMLNYFERAVQIEGFEILAYCIMPNHYHLLVRAETTTTLSKAMQHINQSYSRYYMKRHRYVGHVFQGRFSCSSINTREYLSRVIRYIHQNPVRGRLCQDAFAYYYSSFCEYAGRYTRNILPDNGLLLLEELGFNDVLSFKRYHLESSYDNLGNMLVDNDTINLESKRSIKQYEREGAEKLKESFGDYSFLSTAQRLDFANLLLDSTLQLSKREIAAIAQIDRHRLSED
ncbi:MAG: transposase [Peptostreptococcaceae bacterium]|nr:transposase [Peptostreptococcaceae bacterium]